MGLLVVSTFLLIAHFSTVRAVEIKQCSLPCNRDFKPVCAFHRTRGYYNFPDRCSMEGQVKCKDEYGWRVIHEGKCRSTYCSVDMCPAEYLPVCGLSPTKGYKTYDNRCKYSIENICGKDDYKYIYDGVCEGSNNCTIICTAQYDPVCGYSAKEGFLTFSNQCQMDIRNRCSQGDFIFAHDGNCTDKETGFNNCSRNCDRSYNPVCARNAKNGYMVFSNPCLLRVANKCDFRGFSLIRYGECTPEELNGSCNYACPLYVSSICGYSPLKGFWTFNNKCLLYKDNSCHQSGYRVAHQGSCTPTEIGNRCNRISCPDSWVPVCGKSPGKGFRLFPNYCHLERENCCNFQDYDFVHPGECFQWEYCYNCKKCNAYVTEQLFIQ